MYADAEQLIRWSERRKRLIELDNKQYIQLFHGTKNYDQVLDEGGKPGITRENGYLSYFTSPDFEVAQKYGDVIFLLIPVDELKELNPHIEIFVDGAGDMCVCFVSDTEETGSDQILVPSNWMIDLKEFWYDYEEELPSYVFEWYLEMNEGY